MTFCPRKLAFTPLLVTVPANDWSALVVRLKAPLSPIGLPGQVEDISGDGVIGLNEENDPAIAGERAFVKAASAFLGPRARGRGHEKETEEEGAK